MPIKTDALTNFLQICGSGPSLDELESLSRTVDTSGGILKPTKVSSLFVKYAFFTIYYEFRFLQLFEHETDMLFAPYFSVRHYDTIQINNNRLDYVVT